MCPFCNDTKLIKFLDSPDHPIQDLRVAIQTGENLAEDDCPFCKQIKNEER